MNLQQFGGVAHGICILTLGFIDRFHGAVERATAVADNATEADGVGPQTIRGYYSRTHAWMTSIEKLNNPSDVQAVAVACRALFEGQVDLVLLHHAPKDHPLQMVFDWERSALLKHAEKIDRFFAGKEVPDEYDQFKPFLTSSEVPLIQAARTKWWAGKHPPRWTGRDLATDAKRADALFPEAKLTEFYELEYSPSCWGAHGSSMAGLRSRDPRLVVGTCAVQLVTVQRFALLNLRLILEELGLFVHVAFNDFEQELARRVATLYT